MTQEETRDEHIGTCLLWLSVKVLVGVGAKGVASARSFCPLSRHSHRSIPKQGGGIVACRGIS